MTHAEALAAFENEAPIQVLFEEGAADGFGPRAPLPRFEAALRCVARARGDRRDLAVVRRRCRGRPVERPTGRSRFDHDLPGAAGRRTADLVRGIVIGDLVGRRHLRLARRRPRHVRGLGDRTVGRRHGRGRIGFGRPLHPVEPGRHRPRGHDLGDPSGRPGAVRPERLAASLTSGSRRCGVDGARVPCTPISKPTPHRCPTAGSSWSGSSCSRSPTRFGRGRGSDSPSMLPGATGPCGSSTRSPEASRSRSPTTPTFPSQLVLPVVAGVDVPAGYPDCDALRGQPCRPVRRPVTARWRHVPSIGIAGAQRPVPVAPDSW